MAIEEPQYELLITEDDFEVRKYAPMIVAETWVEGDMDQASNAGFRLIADFIFGNNQLPGSDEQSKIAMTAPVTVEAQSSTIAMTAPVTVEPQSADSWPGSAGRWRIHFVMPSAYTMASIPKPRNDAVKLREIPAKFFAVHKYSWFNTQGRIEQKTQELLDWAQRKSLEVVGVPQLARYNPPWALPWLKRNEIMVEISAPSQS